MEPITAGLLVALASGTAGAAGQQIWASLRDLVARRRRGEAAGDEGELEVPAEPPRSEERAHQLAEVLNERAEQDPDFARALDIWRRRASAEAGIRTGPGEVRNVISGGTQSTVVQARDINGPLTFGG
ncbi:hypothetical protein AQJ91_33385 [Streptomyces dysideae]|uniref:Uncharacterized protein n=1 Tax=Streptomyces dysideae TaxID=909626 RepID=A0A101UU54_9ACTN|nr:hypothetical protein AQJ91_33385 [Streptomyces dysideae]